jgi:hypothetical protein
VPSLPKCSDSYHVVGATKPICQDGSSPSTTKVPNNATNCNPMKSAGATEIHTLFPPPNDNPLHLPGAEGGEVCVGFL